MLKNQSVNFFFSWQYPGSRAGSRPTDKVLFSQLCAELKAAFAPKGLLLSAGVSAGAASIDAGYEVAKISQ